jgi:hypothetical protein
MFYRRKHFCFVVRKLLGAELLEKTGRDLGNAAGKAAETVRKVDPALNKCPEANKKGVKRY